MKKLEEFREVVGYEGKYQVSNFGRVRTLQANGEAGYILKPWLAGKGYPQVGLIANGTREAVYVHVIIAMAFLDHVPNGHERVIDHIDGNKQNNYLWNLRIVTNRENLNAHRVDRDRMDSPYPGVSRTATKWKARIYHDKKQRHLGVFDTELEAANAYQVALEEINK